MPFRTKPLQMSLARATAGQAALRAVFGLSNSTPCQPPPPPPTFPLLGSPGAAS